jgi:hypothetical protein
MCLFMSMILMQDKFDIEINNDGVMKTIWKHKHEKKKSWSSPLIMNNNAKHELTTCKLMFHHGTFIIQFILQYLAFMWLISSLPSYQNFYIGSGMFFAFQYVLFRWNNNDGIISSLYRLNDDNCMLYINNSMPSQHHQMVLVAIPQFS